MKIVSKLIVAFVCSAVVVVLVGLAGVVLAVVALVVFGYLRFKSVPEDLEGNPLSPEAIKKRKEYLDRIIILAASNPRLTDSFVEQQLKVSNNAANRYLGYLTDLGKLIRVNERGQKVFYKLK
jgi:hypothetical protein